MGTHNHSMPTRKSLILCLYKSENSSNTWQSRPIKLRIVPAAFVCSLLFVGTLPRISDTVAQPNFGMAGQACLS